MKQAKTIRKTAEQYDSEWPPEDAAAFMAWFQNRIEDVPPEYRDSLCIELRSTMRDDSSYAIIEFSYVRPETDEEDAQRKQQATTQAERRRADELRTLAALQAKYGKPAA